MKKIKALLVVVCTGVLLTACGNPSQKGVEYLEDGKYDQAIEQFEQAVDKKKNVFQPKTKISSNNTKTSHYVQISLNHNAKSNNSKPKAIGLKQDGIFSQRATMKKDRNEFMVNVPKGNQKIVFPSSAMNSNKIHSNHIAIASKKEEITPFTTKTKKVNLDSAFGHQTKDTNGYKFLKVKETTNHFVTKLKK